MNNGTRPAQPAAPLSAAANLAVEDDEASRALLSRLLESEGYRVPTAADGESGLRTVATCRPDLVLLDVGLRADVVDPVGARAG